MAQEIFAGKYTGRIVDYALGTTKGGDPQVVVLFEFDDLDMHRHEITWFGTLREGKGREITLRALLTLGFQGTDLAGLAEGVPSNALNVDQAVSLTIGPDTNPNTGKTHMRVQWVNPLGGNAFRERMSRDQARVKLGVMNLGGDLAAMRQEMGVRDQPRQAAPRGPVGNAPVGGDFDFGDLP